MVTQEVESVASLAAERQIDVRLVQPLAGGQAVVDPDRFAQIMANLLSNAIKFSPDGAKVKVGLARADENLLVSVTDFGTGIPEEFQSRIFEKFTQADGSDTRSQGGTGLGLSISWPWPSIWGVI